MRLSALVLAAVLLPRPATACAPALDGDGTQRIDGARHVLAWRAPAPLPLAQFFSVEFAVCARDGRAVETPRVDATMPQHGHGMNYQPTVETLGAGRFRAGGLLLHMPGQWQLSFTTGGETLRAALRVD
jgi:hypothetical protein